MLALFGAGHVAEKLLKDGLEADVIFDNNPELSHSSFNNLKIVEPDEKKLKKISKVVICTTSFTDVEKQLKILGYDGILELAKPLEDQKIIKRLNSFKFNGYISSGLPSIDKSSGGGIYQIIETDDLIETKKIFNGNTHGFILREEELVFTCQGRGIVFTDLDGNEIRNISLPDQLRPHGLFLDQSSIFVACSSADCVLRLDYSGKICDRFHFSNKFESSRSPQHHCNDIYVADGCVYVSMFSVSGNWKKGVFDGGIVEIDILTGKKNVLCSHLKMPHNVTQSGGSLYVLNSYEGELLGYDFNSIGSLCGFARGLQFKNDFAIIGESRNRNFSLLQGKKTFASLDSRITIADTVTKVSRSISLGNGISEIHGVVCF